MLTYAYIPTKINVNYKSCLTTVDALNLHITNLVSIAKQYKNWIYSECLNILCLKDEFVCVVLVWYRGDRELEGKYVYFLEGRDPMSGWETRE